jgi:3-oxoacyl-[acyl-carrier protein] reductase
VNEIRGDFAMTSKNVVIYGAGGAIGGAVARAFARDGAKLFLSGRKLADVDAVVKDITAGGGVAEAAEVDALDEQAVEKHAADVVKKTGRLDVSFNVISIPHVQGKPLVEQCVDDFAVPVMKYARTQFLTATIAARYMIVKRSGVILMMTAPPARIARPLVGAFGAACAALEAFSRTLAAEVGPYGVRVVCLRSSGTLGKTDAGRHFERHARAAGVGVHHLEAKLKDATMLRHLATLTDVANMAVFAASDQASALTGTSVNLSCGLAVD